VFDAFKAPIEVHGLRLESLKRITGLSWTRYKDLSDLPIGEGVYGWFTPAVPQVLMYHGRGIGTEGLSKRAGDELRFASYQRARLEKFAELPSDGTGWAVASEAPVIRQITERDLELWFAPAVAAPWSFPNDHLIPSSATEWESFISEVSHLVTGLRSIIGGGAWESKAGTLARSMCDTAWVRLYELDPDLTPRS
jgi:hypothetical protein